MAPAASGGFRALLGEAAWARLDPAVRARFATAPRPGEVRRYAGVMTQVRRSRAGWLIAQACRLVGSPLVAQAGIDVPTLVEVYADPAGRGVVWDRLYRFPHRRALATSRKHVTRNGLLECATRGFAMRLTLREADGALHFVSTGFQWRHGRLRLSVPAWLSPGHMHVSHASEGGGLFRFTLRVAHPLFGETFYQDGLFRAVSEDPC